MRNYNYQSKKENGFMSKVFGGGGGNDDSQNQDQNQNSGNNNNQNSGDPNTTTNNQTNNDKNKSIWDNPNQDQGNNDQNNQNNQNDQNNQQQSDPKTVMAEHIKSLNLTNGLDLNKVQEDLRNGDTTSFNETLETISGNTYQAAITSMNKIMDQKVTAAVEQATQNASSEVNKNIAVRTMNEKLPYTADPDTAPIAKAVLNQFLKRGEDMNVAIQSVEKYFRKTADLINPNGTSSGNDFTNSNNFNQTSNYTNNDNNNQNSQKKDLGHDDWIKLLAQ